MNFTATTAGRAIITHRLTRIPRNGSIALGLLAGADLDVDKLCWCLFWEQGADWSVFLDGAEYDTDRLGGWEPDAIREAVSSAIAALPECEDDMAWFADWADRAEQTLSD